MADSKQKYKRVIDEEGRFVCNTAEYNGHLYSPFEDLENKLNGYKESFPVYDDDIYLLTYPKSGKRMLLGYCGESITWG